MEIMLDKKAKLSELVAGFKAYPQTLINVQVQDKNKIMCSNKVKFVVSDIEEQLEDKGRVILRASGTEPVIRVMVEAESEELCKSMAERLVDAVISESDTH